jgi:EmrB/QacA subfamily drug resistance transporter
MHPGASAPVKLDDRQKWLVLFSLMVTLFVAALDQTVVSTAVPRILADLKGFDLLPWLFTGYMLTSTVVIPLIGKLGDLFGRKLFLIGGVFVFMVSSAACGLAQDMTQLIIFRFVQGLGGGAIFASVFATLGDMFTPAERGKYIGFFTGTFSLASLVGPTFGGFLTDNLGWEWIFFINVPVSLIAMPAIWFNLPRKARASQVRIDYMGAALLAAGSVAFLLALIWGGDRYAWSSPQIVGLFVASVALTALFALQEMRHPEPVLPLHLFSNRTFLLSNLVVFFFGIGVFGAMQYLSLFIQVVLGESATSSGAITTWQSGGVLFSSIIGGQIISRFGRYKWQTVIGTMLIVTSMVLLRLDVDTSINRWVLASYLVILGLGFGLVLPIMSLIVQNAVQMQFLGVATSASQFFRQIGSVMGAAIFGAVLANTYASTFADELTDADRGTLGPGIVSQLGDPTVGLDDGSLRRIEAQAAATAGGAAALARAREAQKEGVAGALQDIYTGALVASILCFVFAFLIKEAPLRRTFGPAQPAGAPGGAPPGGPPGAPVPVAIASPEPGAGAGGSAGAGGGG